MNKTAKHAYKLFYLLSQEQQLLSSLTLYISKQTGGGGS